MKYVKMLGLTAVAAVSLMAFVGSSSASATVLCKVEGAGTPTGTTCPANSALIAGTEIHAVTEEKFRLTTSFQTLECGESTFKGKTSNEGSATETVNITLETWTFTGCNCEIKTLTPGKLEIHWIEGTHNGTLTSSGLETTSQCNTIFGAVHCIYKTNATDLGTLTGSATTKSTATVDISEANIPRLTTSSLCAETAKWDAKYKVDNPDTLNVAGHT